uniref:Dynein associated protein domain-containing protein n=1 Tax=Globodera rostochiensis TaxID=31243 RepID=A0A914HGB1_GLORO
MQQDGLVAELRLKIKELEQTVKKKVEEIEELKEMHVINEEMLEEHKEQQKKVEEDLKDQLDQQLVIVKQFEYQLEEKDRMVEKLEFALVKFREKIDELNEQLTRQQEEIDNQMSAVEMIDRLTIKTLDLEELYKLDIADLEEMYQLNEAIIDGKEDTEKALKQQLDEQMIVISNLKRQISDWEDRAVDYERVIVKFRQKTADLNEEVQSLHDDLATVHAREEKKARNAGTEVSLLANANRTFSEVVEAEQCSIELESVKQQISYLRSFLPDNFTKPGGDNDCLLICVLLPRMSAKVLSLARLLQRKYPPVPGGLRREHVTLSHKAEQWAHVRRFGYQLHVFYNIVQKITSVLKQPSADKALSRLAAIQLDIALQEKSLDQYFGLLRQNRFDENTSLADLGRAVKYFQRLFSTNLSTESYNARDDLRNTLVQIKEGLGWAQFNTHRLRHFLNAPQSSDSMSLATSSAGLELTASILMAKSMTGSHSNLPSESALAEMDFLAFVDRLLTTLTECEGLTIRALNRIPAENDLILSGELTDRLLSAVAALEKCVYCLNECCAMAVSQLSVVDSEGLPAQQLLEFLRGEVEKFAGHLDSQRQVIAHIFDEKERGLELIRMMLEELSAALENSSMEIPPSVRDGSTGDGSPTTSNVNAFSPLNERAYERKRDAVETDGLRWQLSKKDEELLNLQRALKERESEVGTMKLRVDLAKTRLAESSGTGRVSEEMESLRNRCTNDLKRQKEEFEQQLEQLRQQLTEEQNRTRGFSKKALFANMQNQQQQAAIVAAMTASPVSVVASPLSRTGSSSGGDAKAANVYQQQQLDGAQFELRQAMNKIRQLESQHFPDLGALPCPTCTERTRTEQSEFAEMLKESSELVNLSNKYQLRPIDVMEFGSYRKIVDNINFRSQSLRIRFQRWWCKFHPGEPLPEIRLHNF